LGRTVLRLIEPTSGDIFFDGKRIDSNAEEGKGYREWLVPAAIANLWPVKISDDCDLIDDLEDQVLM